MHIGPTGPGPGPGASLNTKQWKMQISKSAPTLWNSLPNGVRFCESVTNFRKHIKHSYFWSAFPDGAYRPTSPGPQIHVWFFALYKLLYLLTYLMADIWSERGWCKDNWRLFSTTGCVDLPAWADKSVFVWKAWLQRAWQSDKVAQRTCQFSVPLQQDSTYMVRPNAQNLQKPSTFALLSTVSRYLPNPDMLKNTYGQTTIACEQ